MSGVLNIIIVGGGIGRLVAALSLRKQGHQTTIIESSAWLRETGAALNLPPNSSRTLRNLGIDLASVKVTPFKGAPCYHDIDKVTPQYGPNGSGQQLLWASRASQEEFYFAHRVDLHEDLQTACRDPAASGPPAQVLLSSKVVDYDADNGTVTLQDGSIMEADFIVAADGVHSKASSHVLGYDCPSIPGGVSDIRFIIPTSEIQEDPVTRKILDDVGAMATYRAAPPRGDMVLRYPCRNNELQNFGAYRLTTPPETSEDATNNAARPSVSGDELIQFLKDFPPEIEAIALKAPETLYLWTLADRPPLPSYHCSKLILLGDAAHAMYTWQGQGGSQSIEDGAVLGIVFSHLQDNSAGQVQQRLDLYNDLRVGRASVAQLLSRNRGSLTYIAAEVSEKIAMVLEKMSTRQTGARKGIEILDRKYRDAKERGELANHDDITDFFWNYDCVRDAEEVLQRFMTTTTTSSIAEEGS